MHPADIMADSELEAHIKSCGQLMQDAMSRYEQSGCFSDRGEADYWRIAMESAIKSRSPEQVARMETDRGIL